MSYDQNAIGSSFTLKSEQDLSGLSLSLSLSLTQTHALCKNGGHQGGDDCKTCTVENRDLRASHSLQKIRPVQNRDMELVLIYLSIKSYTSIE